MYIHILPDMYFAPERSEVLKSLEQVVYSWFDLGLQLGLSDGVLHKNNNNNNNVKSL